MMIRMPLLAALLLAACSADPPREANEAVTAAVPAGSGGGVTPSPRPLPSVLPGVPEEPDPHPAPDLQPMVRADFQDRQLLGSGCDYRDAGSGAILLHLRDEGDGLVKYGNRLRRIAAATPGREAIALGGIAAGDGVSFILTPQPGDPVQTSDSTQSRPASLTMRTADNGESVYQGGRWDCGS